MTGRWLLAVALLTCACADKAPPEDLAKLSRPKQILELRASAAQAGDAKQIWQKLGEVAMDEGEAQTAIEAFQKSGDAAQEKAARLWMEPDSFPAPPTGSAPDLLASATSVQLAIDSTFAVRANVIAKLNQAGRLFFAANDRQSAGTCVTRAQPLVAAIMKTVHPSLYAFHLAADHEALYGDMLFANRHWGDARALYQNNVLRFKNWNPPNDYTRRRLSEAQAKVLLCEKKMIPTR